jgi:galactokinase
MSDSLSKAIKEFENQFGRPPQFVARAPGRVNLIGEHVDYNGGLVLPMAIERCTYIAADLATHEDHSRIYSANLKEVKQLRLDDQIPGGEDHWLSYFLGVMRLFPASIPNLDVVIYSEIPIGAGLSSSAALEVALLKVLEAVSGVYLDPLEGALLCQQAENEFAGVPCGMMDQVASMVGRKDHAVLIDCAQPTFEFIDGFNDDISFLIVNSMQSHSLAAGAYAERRSECEKVASILGVESLACSSVDELNSRQQGIPPGLFRRARHVLTEIERVNQFINLIYKQDWVGAGMILYQSHQSLRDDFEVSAPGLDTLVEIAEEIGVAEGVFGCRMTGGGFGGSVITLVDSPFADSVAFQFVEAYEQRVGVTPDFLLTAPAAGAAILIPDA